MRHLETISEGTAASLAGRACTRSIPRAPRRPYERRDRRSRRARQDHARRRSPLAVRLVPGEPGGRRARPGRDGASDCGKVNRLPRNWDFPKRNAHQSYDSAAGRGKGKRLTDLAAERSDVAPVRAARPVEPPRQRVRPAHIRARNGNLSLKRGGRGVSMLALARGGGKIDAVLDPGQASRGSAQRCGRFSSAYTACSIRHAYALGEQAASIA
jgi:hypothetical protein